MRQIINNGWLLLMCFVSSVQVASAGADADSRQFSINSPPVDYIELTVAETSVPALYRTDRSGRHYGAVLLLHDKNGAMDSRGPVSALRRLLPEHGWSVMSVALSYQKAPATPEPTPVDASDEQNPTEQTTDSADTPEAAAQPATRLTPVADSQRIQAAIAHMQADNPKRLILAGMGAGALQAIRSLASLPAPPAGLVMISSPAIAEQDKNILTNLALPVLDITAGNARAALKRAARDRITMMKRIQRDGYSQRTMAGADAAFYTQREMVAKQVRNWLYQRFIAPERTP